MLAGLTRWSAYPREFSSVEGTWPRARSRCSLESSSWLSGTRNSTETALDRAATGAVDDTAAATAINGGWGGAEPLADWPGGLGWAVGGSWFTAPAIGVFVDLHSMAYVCCYR